MKINQTHIIRLADSQYYTFTYKGDTYTEPTWYFVSLKQLKKAVKLLKNCKYPGSGYYDTAQSEEFEKEI
jgi:hypothetical protein